jgi:hypothetical protein
VASTKNGMSYRENAFDYKVMVLFERIIIRARERIFKFLILIVVRVLKSDSREREASVTSSMNLSMNNFLINYRRSQSNPSVATRFFSGCSLTTSCSSVPDRVGFASYRVRTFYDIR